ncbi:MAG: acetyl-CoA decarbonylase/synthase complex subunit gamma [Candidatus Bathyarchaeia archaeon]|nr:acetyl-CoA decarbonylase/synthase complex subunit gamma [Candidatus Bathyarchaeota archaeon]
MSKPSPIVIYNFLPKKNCGECKFPTCIAFALKLIEGEANVEDCPYLTEEQKIKLSSLVSPPVKIVSFGKRKLVIGGEKVLHRHELRFFHPTIFSININDSLNEEKIKERAVSIKNFKIERAGEKFSIDSVTITSTSGNHEKFKKAIKIVRDVTDSPLILYSLNPKVIQAGVEEAIDEKPILCSAKPETLESFIEISKRYSCPLTLESNDLNELKFMAGKIEGLEILLNPGDSTIKPFNLLSNVITVRRCGIEFKMKEFSHPILIGLHFITEEQLEPLLAAMLIIRYANVLILNSLSVEVLLPLFILRQSVYSNPRVPAMVQPGLYEVGKPNKNSPVILTTNYALTYYLVTGDLEASSVNCYVLVFDSQGLSVLNALAGGLLSSESIKKLIQESKIEEKVFHRKLIIPGAIGKLKWEIEEATGWKVIVGPEESSELPAFLRKFNFLNNMN